jgi:23S rRNA (uracil1939-C5)-methyltransferase
MDQVQTADVEVLVTDLDRQGRGVARHDGEVLFVEGGLPGDRAEVRLMPRRRGQVTAQMLHLLEPSPQRRRSPCILADHCGGCSLQPFSPLGQEQWKGELVRQTLQRIGGLNVPVEPLMASPQELGYRNRAIIPLERSPEGRLRAGFYRRGSHQIVNMNRCPVLDPRLDALIAPLKADLEASPWPVDRHGRDGGGLRHLALRVGQNSGELLLTLIASDADLEGLSDQAQVWMRRWPELVGVTLNLQPQPTNLLFGPETRTLAGRDWLHERFAGLVLQIASDTFFQVNTSQAERLVPLLESALPTAPGLLVDAYCGIGTYSLPMARLGWEVLGLELHSGSVALAQRNAALNGLSERCRFQTTDVAEALDSVLPQTRALLLDPPRKGLDPRVLAAIAACPPPQLLYLSCDPATLARDLRQLCTEGYQLISVQPIDFFPNTTHVETWARLTRAN